MTSDRANLPRSEATLALAAWRLGAGSAALSPSQERRAQHWLRAAWQTGATHIPLTFAFDLGAVLLFGRRYRFRAGNTASDDAADAEPGDASIRRRFQRFRLSYQDKVISKWLIDPALQELHIHIAGLDEDAQDRAISHAIALSLSRRLADVETLVVGNAAFLRASAGPTDRGNGDEASEDDAVVLAPVPTSWLDWVAETLQPALSPLAASPLLTPEDAWEVRHLDRLPTESTRLALRQIHKVAGQIGPLAATSALTLRQRAREVPIEKEDADAYPTGGFDAISTQGTFENLVRSEIAYVGEGRVTDVGIDLFDVRFAENELLFYTRDESPVLDAFRRLTISVDEPERMRVKAPEAEAQTQVLVLGLALALQADMIRAFGAAASKTVVCLHCRGVADQAAADEDLALLELSLRSEIKHLRAQLMTTNDEEQALNLASGVVFSMRPRPHDSNAFAWIRVDSASWSWSDDETTEAFETVPQEKLRQLADAILFAVAAGGRRPS